MRGRQEINESSRKDWWMGKRCSETAANETAGESSIRVSGGSMVLAQVYHQHRDEQSCDKEEGEY